MANKPRTTWLTKRAFTLVEILVVVSIIVLVLAMAIPSIGGLFTAGADAQAYNIISAQLSAARALAIQNQTYAGVHVQLADSSKPETRNLVHACFTAVVWNDPNTPDANFSLAPGFSPRRLPGGMALGQLFLNDYGTYSLFVDSPYFCNFTVVFSPSGQLPDFLTFVWFDLVPPFSYQGPGDKTYLWNPYPTPPIPVKGFTLFNGDKFFALPAPDKPHYLDMNSQAIGVNRYTGAVLSR